MTGRTFARYDAYKDSGERWLGEIPAEWEVVRNKEIFEERSTRSLTGEEMLLTVSHITGVTPRSEKNVNMFMAETLEGYKLCHKGDLLVNTMWAWMGALGTSRYEGICSPSYNVYKPRKGIPYYHRYFDYLYRTPNAVVEMTRNSKGIVSSRLRLYPTEFFQIRTILPDSKTQRAIAAYLDARTATLDRQIALLTQKAARYAGLKQALINHTVTHGLDPAAPLKDSGIEWIGEIPAHWIDRRHKDNFILVIDRCNDTTLEKVGLENIESKTGRFIHTGSTFEGDGICFKVNDILFGKLRPYLAKVYLAEFNGSAVGDIFVYRPKSNMLPRFAQYLMLSTRYIGVMNGSTIGAKMPRVSSSFIANLPVMTPPLPEQHAIAAYLDAQTAHINRIIETIDAKIAALQELRQTLINDVVTGKIKVCDA